MKTTDFDYNLPLESIAQHPVEPRDAARLMVLNRQEDSIHHSFFYDLDRLLCPNDLLVLNETRVIPARLYARKIPTGGRVEILLLRRQDAQTWETLVGGKGLSLGKRLQVEQGPQAEIVGILEGSRRLVSFLEPVENWLSFSGHTPLPPYIHEPLENPERYQTIYARQPGSVAAPTAGLHFTAELIERLKVSGVGFATITLHVGLDTFAPVTEQTPDEHRIHTEWCQVTPQAAESIQKARKAGGRVIAVGTTCVRALETAGRAAPAGLEIGEFEGATDLFILPGYKFRLVDGMITNFHLPKSSLIMLVSGFAGRERILRAYQVAINEGYRFYSFGDAMLIL
jgi:S-adenosylmethionine:tRNA ribosyltransferase-isomerase